VASQAASRESTSGALDDNIGVVEVINPVRGVRAADDLAFLEAIAADIAIACEKARLYDRLRRETRGLRRVSRLAGLALLAVGLAFGLGALYAQVAWALPLGELPTRPAMLIGVFLLVAGAGLVGVARGWLVATTPDPNPP